MSHPQKPLTKALLCTFFTCLFTGMVYAQTPVFPLVGNATSLGGDCYQLTPADDYMHGAVWFQQQLNLTQPFDIRVTFNFGNTHAWLTGCANPANCADPTYVYPQEGGGADGIAFLLQQQGSGAGSTGSGIGYGNSNGNGISPSLAIEFDTYFNFGGFDPIYDHIGVAVNGDERLAQCNLASNYHWAGSACPNQLAGATNVFGGINNTDILVPAVGTNPATDFLQDGQNHRVRFKWNPATKRFQVWLDCKLKIDFTGDITSKVFGNNPNVYYGFTSATGSEFNKHTVCVESMTFSANIPDATICEGASVQLNPQIQGFSAGTTYSWSPATGLSSTSIPNPMASPALTTTYTLVIQDPCYLDTLVRTVKVNVHPRPQVTLLSKDSCTSPLVTLSALSSNAGDVNYSWNPQTGLTFLSGDSLVQFAAPGVAYTVTATSSYGCTGTAIFTPGTNTAINISFNIPPVCFNLPSIATNIQSTASTFSWDFGDGSPVVQNTSQHTYSAPGQYIVTCTAYAGGCSGTYTDTAIVYPLPQLSMSDLAACEQQVIAAPDFMSTPSGASFSWINNNATIGLGASGAGNIGSFTGTTNAGQINSATVTVTPTLNGCVGPDSTFNILVSPVPLISVVNPQPYCPGDTVPSPVIAAVPNTIAMQYTWVNSNSIVGLPGSGTGIPPNFIAQPQPNLSAAPIAAVVTINPSLNGCIGAPQSYTVTVKPSPQVEPLPDIHYCPNVLTAPVPFNASPSGTNLSFSWTAGNPSIGLPSASGNAAVLNAFTTINTGNTAETSTLSVYATLDGCKGPDETFSLSVSPKPKADFVHTNKLCLGDSLKLQNQSANIGNPLSFAWSLDNIPATFSTVQHPVVLIAAPGKHAVILEVLSAAGCRDTVEKTVFINPIPVAKFSGAKEGCPALTINQLFTDQSYVDAPSAITGWSWNFGNGASSFQAVPFGTLVYPNNSFNQVLTYTVSLVVTSDSGCVSLPYSSPAIKVYPRPKAGFHFETNDAVAVNNPVFQFVSEAQGADFYDWNFGDYMAQPPAANTSSLTNPAHTYENAPATSYTVTQWVSNQYGCRDSIRHTLELLPDWTFYIPNAFTPDHNGINDGFRGTGINIYDYNLWIFDRWGNQVFYSGDLDEFWDGRMQGKEALVQQDVYVWKVNFRDIFGKKHTRYGTVTVVR